ncbi:hypothetical protein A8B78_05080 [Jannaschia sp. EhC01]|nr:hypothetical protein A8B78_05080 [Jannaschia sp. EhC01]
MRVTGTAMTPQSPEPVPLTRHTRDAAQDAPSPREGQPVRIGGWTIAPASQPAPVIAAPPPTTALPLATTITNGLDAINDTLPDLDFALQTPSSVLSTTALTPSTSVLSHAPSATAQTIAQQISAALTNRASENTDAPLELALDPPELGRVRMQITDVAGAMTLVIQAERPETADLMRRHLELLAQEFAQAGLDAPSVQIRQEGDSHSGGTAHRDAHDGPSNRSVDPDIEGTRPLPQRTAAGGLDLRL